MTKPKPNPYTLYDEETLERKLSYGVEPVDQMMKIIWLILSSLAGLNILVAFLLLLLDLRVGFLVGLPLLMLIPFTVILTCEIARERTQNVKKYHVMKRTLRQKQQGNPTNS